MAQKGFDVQKEITINVSADRLWDMVGPGFVEVYKWSSNVDFAEGSGTSEFAGAVCSKRVCNVNVKGFSKISETLTKYDDSKMNLAYEVNDGMPGFVTRAVNDWTVIPVGSDESKLLMKAEFRSKGLMGAVMNSMMEKKMKQTLAQVLKDAKVFAETGRPSEAKRKRVEELARKSRKAA
ncbi:MAG: SRPBCC family protein [Bacteroidota bacterium]